MVLEVSVTHVTYRATVTVTLHIGPHECKNRRTVSIWSRYDISYHNLLLLEKCERRKKINNNWVEGTPNLGLLEDFLSVNQFQLYHVIYVSV